MLSFSFSLHSSSFFEPLVTFLAMMVRKMSDTRCASSVLAAAYSSSRSEPSMTVNSQRWRQLTTTSSYRSLKGPGRQHGPKMFSLW
eukprot:jgi/Chrzof1/11644/Cz06g03140.t1